MDTRLKPRTLKFAPAWKRAAAFVADSIFLTLFLSLMIAVAYGKDLSTLYKTVEEIGGLNLMLKEGLFATQLDIIRQSPKNIQDFIYIQNIITTRYYYLIYVYYQILTVGYFSFFWYYTGQTLGARIFGIRVVTQDIRPMALTTALLRSALLKLYEYAYYLPAMIVINPRLRQRVHDKLSKTVVIENKDWEEMAEEMRKFLEEEEHLHQDVPPKDRE